MRKVLSVVANLLVLFLAARSSRAAVNTKEFAVQLSATVQENPAQITLSWPQDACGLPEKYVIYRKAPDAAAWGIGTTLPGKSTAYVDKNVTLGTRYEYQIVKKTAQYTGYGYICAGIKVP